jgi:hypothetical protein
LGWIYCSILYCLYCRYRQQRQSSNLSEYKVLWRICSSSEPESFTEEVGNSEPNSFTNEVSNSNSFTNEVSNSNSFTNEVGDSNSFTNEVGDSNSFTNEVSSSEPNPFANEVGSSEPNPFANEVGSSEPNPFADFDFDRISALVGNFKFEPSNQLVHGGSSGWNSKSNHSLHNDECFHLWKRFNRCDERHPKRIEQLSEWSGCVALFGDFSD